MSMRDDWKAAKKMSKENFDKAYKSWVDDRRKKSKGEAIKTIEEAIGKELTATYAKPMTFKSDLGPTLDKLEKAHEKADAAVAAITLKDMLTKKAITNLWKTWAEKISYTSESYHFLTAGFKDSPNKIYENYIQAGSALQLNIDGSLKEKWDNCAQANNWKAAKSLVAPTVTAIHNMTASDSVPKFRKDDTISKFLRTSLGGKEVPALIKKARSICVEYGRQSQAYGKRWQKQKPDFWTPINKALNDILGTIDGIAKKYPT